MPTADLRADLLRHVTYSLAETPDEVGCPEAFRALADSVRDRLVDGRLATEERYRKVDAKRLYYLSMEFLIGRSLRNNLLNLGLLDAARDATSGMKLKLDQIEDCESDAALGNGGLGRLAACYLDSLATLGMPGFGYGINYEYGLFRQEIRNGEQVEKPDNWRALTSPWMIERPQDAVIVPMYGRVEHTRDRAGGYNPMWLDWKIVLGIPHDMFIAGYGGKTVNVLRLYSARASSELDMAIFNLGDYLAAVEQQVRNETISKVLYPSDSRAVGRELRLQQEYFLVACAVRDLVRQYMQNHQNFDAFPDKVAVQLNDTHPTLAIVELMRIMIDEHDVDWDRAWEITQATFGYTNHTLLPEALERWPITLIELVLPRHLQIIYEINRRFLAQVSMRWPNEPERVGRMSLIEENPEKQVRMANLAIVGSHSVNGVAAVHSRLVRTDLVPDFAALWPQKFRNVTNGVTPRRWLLSANPGLAALLTEAVGPTWITDLDLLHKIEPLAGDAGFREKFAAVKRANKDRLTKRIHELGIAVDPDSLFDVQVKRMHEYKRQLLNVLHVVFEYLRLADDGVTAGPPRTYLFGGKAAPGYHAAKQIIKLINDVAAVVNADKRVNGHMRVAFLPDYSVTLAERIIPAADLSEQISTAGTEASGTGNMKFALNGALTIGTLDGANIEIREEVGAENIFIFGLTVEMAKAVRSAGYRPREAYERSPAARRVLDAIQGDRFCPRSPGRHDWVAQKLLADGEPYLHLADLDSYLDAHAAAGALFGDRAAWAAKAILNVARVGKFSSDRAIREYAAGIWGIKRISE
jgi:starch phosphorylase